MSCTDPYYHYDPARQQLHAYPYGYDAYRNAYAREFTLRDAERCIEDLSEQTRELRAYRARQTIRNAVAFVWLVVLTVVAWMLGG